MAMIYLDNAATTPVRKEVVEAMMPFYFHKFGNPSGIYEFASERRKEIQAVRKQIAETLHAQDNEIYFTSGGTESDNWAIKSAAKVRQGKGKHIITSSIEHHAVLNTCAALSEKGFRITYLKVDENGMVRPEDVEKAIQPDTILISIMYANNEVGTIQPMKAIGALAKKYHILFHTDAVQAYGQLPIDVSACNIDMLSASGHKLNGPKGIGFLYVRKEVNLPSFIHGGQQEKGKRAGTENVAGIIGLGKAVELAFENQKERCEYVSNLRDYLIERLLKEVPYSRLNGSWKNRLPGNCNVSFQFIEGASLLILLDTEQICASSGSACSFGSSKSSHVLSAMGIPDSIAHGTLRLTLGYQNTMEEIDKTIYCIKKYVEKLRKNSPEYEDYQKGY